ncbi:metal cation transporter, ZIP family [Peptoniphilus sp. ING2-D1G]|nr:metal cation transporter, ZIP family [Peptoniphilus sp. ING2-D1G]
MGILIPFIGTSLGAALVFFLKDALSENVKKALNGFASGVMVAASFFSLIIPALEESAHLGKYAFVPAVVGFWIGILFLLALDHLIPHFHELSHEQEGLKTNLSRSTMITLAVTLHNIPEGMAIGIIYAGYLSGETSISLANALALSIGIALQNFPEGAIVSLPIKAQGTSKVKSFWYGVLSGIVEPIGAVITVLLSEMILPSLPYLLSMAAGAMIYVVVEELIPEISHDGHTSIGILSFSLGFSMMMVLNVILG